MAFQGTRDDLRPVDAETDRIVLNSRDCRLRNTGHPGELVLVQFLKLTNDSNGLSDGDRYALLGGTICFHGGFDQEGNR